MIQYLTPQPSIHTQMDTSTMSLAILPSQHMGYSGTSAPSPLRPSRSPAKRPKLSLDTNNVPSIFGKSSTSLRLETLSATSPTARNTFRNALDPVTAQNKKTNTKPNLSSLKIATESSPREPEQIQPTTTNDSAASSATTTSSLSSIDSFSTVVPYKLTFNTTSILINSPLPRTSRRSHFGHQKPMFPAPKKVAFREPLTEDVKNTRFTLRHSDIESSTSTISTLELTQSDSELDEDAQDQKTEKPVQDDDRPSAKSPPSPHTGDKRESSDEEESDSDSCPATPVAGRRKRHRQWVWTLGPVNGEEKLSSHQENEVVKIHSDDERDQ
ncbi:hypothetical protein CB0940_00122 [Cercospora beticola]|uniref:Uncharacterized protein n=2 Tax=Cercospora beticola TaxID=122368 RepID=A0A2G5I9R3_CERBT|nr:hypothetical protein CB0940_00122 [Cercospora beticola]PIB01254.1 hypothetical protein CB0940_00122 [Cercospora beticola]